MKTIEAVATTAAPRSAVWALLEDASSWARWGVWSSVQVEGGGGQRVGAVRVLVNRPFRVRERITEWEPASRIGYELLEGMRVRGYRSTLTLEDAPGGGTRIRWSSSYEQAGPLTAFLLRLAVGDACKRLANAASTTPTPT